MASVHVERVSRSLVGNRTLRGLGYSSLGLGPLGGSSLLGKGPGHLMLAVASTGSRRGRAFSGAAAARVVGVVVRRT
jgi:hypothetical protein